MIHRLSRQKPLPEIAAFLRKSAEIAQYYVITADAQKVAVTLRDEIFREASPLNSLNCHLKVGRRGHFTELPLPLSRLRPLGRLAPLLQANHSRTEVEQGLADLPDDDRNWARICCRRLKPAAASSRVRRTRTTS